VDAEKSLVVRQVRDLINQAKQLYNQNTFDRAVEILDQAQARHKTVFPDDNPEVVYWRGFAKAAMDARSGREVVLTDALYAEIRQALSQAGQFYERGRELLQQANRPDALLAFKRAEEVLNYIKQMSPLNQERSVLALRIEQLRDRDIFIVNFRRIFQEARAKLAGKPEEAYTDLKDLEQIDPAFPGIKDAIYNAEIALRIRVPPPDPRMLAQSDQLYQQAFRIVSTNIRAQFPIALEQLNKALEMNPNNQRAVELKDRIQADAGGQTAVVLSSGAEQQYRIAEQRFIDGKFLEALAIVERLLQNRESKNYPPLLELKRRIESRI
jgi:tetratricopeptide (TPR) repeat protein